MTLQLRSVGNDILFILHMPNGLHLHQLAELDRHWRNMKFPASTLRIAASGHGVPIAPGSVVLQTSLKPRGLDSNFYFRLLRVFSDTLAIQKMVRFTKDGDGWTYDATGVAWKSYDALRGLKYESPICTGKPCVQTR